MNQSVMSKLYLGKEIEVVSGPNQGRIGIITDILNERKEIRGIKIITHGDCVILWDDDENVTIDNNGKTVYNMFDPVSVIDLEEIRNTENYEVF